MAFLKSTIDLSIYTDSAETEFPKELVTDIQKEYENSDVTEVQSTTIVLAGAASQAITLNGVATVKRWYIYSSATELSLAINGLSAVTCQAAEPGYLPITLSSLTITNAHATTSTTVTLVLIAS